MNRKRNWKRISRQGLGAILALLLVTGCGTPAAPPVPPTCDPLTGCRRNLEVHRTYFLTDRDRTENSTRDEAGLLLRLPSKSGKDIFQPGYFLFSRLKSSL